MRHRHDLPQMRDDVFLTDGGLETTLVFHEGLDLPLFASYPLVADAEGRDRLRRYYQPYLEVARAHGRGFLLDTPTWRANPDWASRLGHDAQQLAELNRQSVRLVAEIRAEQAGTPVPIVISGVVGPRGDGYRPDARMQAAEARDYHADQIRAFAATEADMIGACTLNYPEEAIGVALAAADAGMPASLSFTVETDGRLPSGETLPDAIAAVDAATNAYPAYYMINCAHPRHFEHVLQEQGSWRERLRGVRANASARSHAELDEATELDSGDPLALGQDYRRMRRALPHLCVLGGCCGTDHRHVRAICEAVMQA